MYLNRQEFAELFVIPVVDFVEQLKLIGYKKTEEKRNGKKATDINSISCEKCWTETGC